MIALFLFNLVGYRFIFDYAQKQSDIRLEASLDNDDYNDAELITLQVPLTVPYQIDRQDFERVNGEVSYQGKIYKYVKRKISGGQLVLLCLPDHNKMRLQSAKDDFFKNANDLVQNNHSKKSDHSKTNVKNISSDYIAATELANPNVFLIKTVNKSNRLQFYLPQLSPQLPLQPPDFI